MSTRRQSREWAVQLLFQLDLNEADDLEEVFHAFWVGNDGHPRARAFTEELVRGVREHRHELDACLKRVAEHWDIRRIGVIERNVIRLALFEMQFRDDIPPVVSINEAVDIAKYFSNNESGKFVNGILDRVRQESGGGTPADKNPQASSLPDDP